MKRSILSAVSLCFFLFRALAQPGSGSVVPPSPGTSQYELQKQAGSLPQGLYRVPEEGAQELRYTVQPAPSTSVACACMIPVDDGTFSIVPFTIGTAPEYRNDDGSSPQISLPFSFCFYGQQMTNCYINNNGNVSFGAPYPTFSANAFPDLNFVMIAPFWGDVDSRSTTSGLVYYKITPTSMIVRWRSVDFFQAIDPLHQSLYDDFQLIITNGSDPILPPGNNVSFCYGDMQWTTGDASSGVNGFGGVPATVGVNRGNGVDFIQIGQFDAPGSNYDGPFGNPDQVSWLDSQTFYFDACSNNGNNLPPIINSAQVCDTIEICVGDTFDIAATFLSPEQGQITSITVNPNGLQGFSLGSNNSGNPAVVGAQLIASPADVGYHYITITGTDNGSPPQSTTANVIIHIINVPSVSFTFNPTLFSTGMPVQFTANTPGATQWWWSFGDGDTSMTQNPSHTYLAGGVYTVTLTAALGTGCSASYNTTITVSAEPIVYDVVAPNVFTPNGDGHNDALEFENLLYYTGSHLHIYNRWGKLVYENNDYRNDWKPASAIVDGVYYFVLDVPGLQKSLTGFVELIR